MENISDVIGSGKELVGGAVAAAGIAGAWLASKLEWWKSQSKGVKVATAVGAFLAIAITLSLITAPFT